MRSFFVLTFCFLLTKGIAQKYDNNWVMGDRHTIYNFETGDTSYIDSISNETAFWHASSSLSDKNGKLLFFSNGINVMDSEGEPIMNSDKLEFGHADSAYFPGLPYTQGCLLLPMPGSDSLIYFFHTATIGVGANQANRVYYSVIDRKANNNNGSFVSWNNILIDTLVTDAGMGFCKHANGVDWWLVKPRYSSNVFTKYLIKGNCVFDGPFNQNIGMASIEPDWLGQLCFSAKGDKLAYCGANQKGNLFDFDRCTGNLYNPRTFFEAAPGYVASGTGVSFSFSGKFMYATGDSFKIFQYNIEDPNFNSSRIAVRQNGVYNVRKPFYHQIAPNGKIYIAGYGSPIPLTVINNPDSFGLACNMDTFAFDPFYKPSFTFGMPCFPHYRTPPSAAYAAEAGGDTTVCDSLLQLSVGIPLGAPAVDSVVYEWSSPNDAGFGGSTQAQIIVQPTTSAMYVLHIQDTSLAPKYSCTERWDTVYVTVVQNCITEIDDRQQTTDGSEIQVSPNPTKNYTTWFYHLAEHQKATLVITNQLGEVVYNGELPANQYSYTVYAGNWATGVYNYRITVDGKAAKRDKFVVIK